MFCLALSAPCALRKNSRRTSIFTACTCRNSAGCAPVIKGCIRAVRKKLKEIRPDIVHGQGTERDCAISAVFSGFPNIITIHGNMVALEQLHRPRFGTYGWCAARLEEFTLPRTQGIICISDYVQNLVKNYGVPTWIVPNAIQKMFFDFPKTIPPAGERPLLVNVGVISERKRQPELLALLTSLREEGLKFDTLFVGRSSPELPYAVEFNANWNRRTGNMAASNISRGWMTRLSASCLTGLRP